MYMASNKWPGNLAMWPIVFPRVFGGHHPWDPLSPRVSDWTAAHSRAVMSTAKSASGINGSFAVGIEHGWKPSGYVQFELPCGLTPVFELQTQIATGVIWSPTQLSALFCTPRAPCFWFLNGMVIMFFSNLFLGPLVAKQHTSAAWRSWSPTNIFFDPTLISSSAMGSHYPLLLLWHSQLVKKQCRATHAMERGWKRSEVVDLCCQSSVFLRWGHVQLMDPAEFACVLPSFSGGVWEVLPAGCTRKPGARFCPRIGSRTLYHNWVSQGKWYC